MSSEFSEFLLNQMRNNFEKTPPPPPPSQPLNSNSLYLYQHRHSDREAIDKLLMRSLPKENATTNYSNNLNIHHNDQKLQATKNIKRLYHKSERDDYRDYTSLLEQQNRHYNANYFINLNNEKEKTRLANKRDAAHKPPSRTCQCAKRATPSSCSGSRFKNKSSCYFIDENWEFCSDSWPKKAFTKETEQLNKNVKDVKTFKKFPVKLIEIFNTVKNSNSIFKTFQKKAPEKSHATTSYDISSRTNETRPSTIDKRKLFAKYFKSLENLEHKEDDATFSMKSSLRSLQSKSLRCSSLISSYSKKDTINPLYTSSSQIDCLNNMKSSTTKITRTCSNLITNNDVNTTSYLKKTRSNPIEIKHNKISSLTKKSKLRDFHHLTNKDINIKKSLRPTVTFEINQLLNENNCRLIDKPLHSSSTKRNLVAKSNYHNKLRDNKRRCNSNLLILDNNKNGKNSSNRKEKNCDEDDMYKVIRSYRVEINEKNRHRYFISSQHLPKSSNFSSQSSYDDETANINTSSILTNSINKRTKHSRRNGTLVLVKRIRKHSNKKKSKSNSLFYSFKRKRNSIKSSSKPISNRRKRNSKSKNRSKSKETTSNFSLEKTTASSELSSLNSSNKTSKLFERFNFFSNKKMAAKSKDELFDTEGNKLNSKQEDIDNVLKKTRADKIYKHRNKISVAQKANSSHTTDEISTSTTTKRTSSERATSEKYKNLSKQKILSSWDKILKKTSKDPSSLEKMLQQSCASKPSDNIGKLLTTKSSNNLIEEQTDDDATTMSPTHVMLNKLFKNLKFINKTTKDNEVDQQVDEENVDVRDDPNLDDLTLANNKQGDLIKCLFSYLNNYSDDGFTIKNPTIFSTNTLNKLQDNPKCEQDDKKKIHEPKPHSKITSFVPLFNRNMFKSPNSKGSNLKETIKNNSQTSDLATSISTPSIEYSLASSPMESKSSLNTKKENSSSRKNVTKTSQHTRTYQFPISYLSCCTDKNRQGSSTIGSRTMMDLIADSPQLTTSKENLSDSITEFSIKETSGRKSSLAKNDKTNLECSHLQPTQSITTIDIDKLIETLNDTGQIEFFKQKLSIYLKTKPQRHAIINRKENDSTIPHISFNDKTLDYGTKSFYSMSSSASSLSYKSHSKAKSKSNVELYGDESKFIYDNKNSNNDSKPDSLNNEQFIKLEDPGDKNKLTDSSAKLENIINIKKSEANSVKASEIDLDMFYFTAESPTRPSVVTPLAKTKNKTQKFFSDICHNLKHFSSKKQLISSSSKEEPKNQVEIVQAELDEAQQKTDRNISNGFKTINKIKNKSDGTFYFRINPEMSATDDEKSVESQSVLKKSMDALKTTDNMTENKINNKSRFKKLINDFYALNTSNVKCSEKMLTENKNQPNDSAKADTIKSSSPKLSDTRKMSFMSKSNEKIYETLKSNLKLNKFKSDNCLANDQTSNTTNVKRNASCISDLNSSLLENELEKLYDKAPVLKKSSKDLLIKNLNQIKMSGLGSNEIKKEATKSSNENEKKIQEDKSNDLSFTQNSKSESASNNQSRRSSKRRKSKRLVKEIKFKQEKEQSNLPKSSKQLLKEISDIVQTNTNSSKVKKSYNSIKTNNSNNNINANKANGNMIDKFIFKKKRDENRSKSRKHSIKNLD